MKWFGASYNGLNADFEWTLMILTYFDTARSMMDN